MLLLVIPRTLIRCLRKYKIVWESALVSVILTVSFLKVTLHTKIMMRPKNTSHCKCFATNIPVDFASK